MGGLDQRQLSEMFSDFGFRGLAERVAKLEPAEAPTAPTAAEANYQLIDTPEKRADLDDRQVSVA